MDHKHPSLLTVEDMLAIGRVPLLSGLGADDLARVLGKARLHRHPAGEVLFRQGDRAEGLHVVLEGQVGLTGHAADGAETVVEILGPGEPFIMAAVLTAKPYLMGAVALKRSRVLVLPADRLRSELLRSPDLALAMLVSLAENFRMLVREVKDLKLKTAAQRLARYLASLSGGEGAATVVLGHSKATIAARLGIRPESLSRAFSQLSAQGVTVRGRQVAIADLARLRSFAENGNDSGG